MPWLRFWLMGQLRARAAAGLVLGTLLLVSGCSSSDQGSPAGGGTGDRPTVTGSPSSSGGSAKPTPAATSDTPRQVPADQRFSFDETARYDDGLQIEIAGTVADKAKQTDQGAEATRGEIVIASVRIQNGTAQSFPAADVLISASYGDGKDAQIIIDKTDQLQSGFRVQIRPHDEEVATLGFAIPFTELGKVTFVVDPNDDVHDPVSFTGKVEHG
jgi:hypothetical protein